MKILAIDTSSKICSVAITEDTKKIIVLNSNNEKTHSVKLMPMINEALLLSHLTLDDINLFVCSIGPGSFTGVRIGIATIKAFADVKNIPVVGVSSLEGLAYNILNQRPISSSELICTMIDAKNDNVYSGLFKYDTQKNTLFPVYDFSAEDIKTTVNKIQDFANENQISHINFVGDGCNFHKTLIQDSFNSIQISFAKEIENCANSVSIASCGYVKYQNGILGDSSILSPLYLRKSQAERALEESK